MLKVLVDLEIRKNKIKELLLSSRGEFGVSIIINIAIALIIAAFILLPNMKSFSKKLMTDITDWYTNTLKNSLFDTSI
ncbi:hypothetical protein [Helicovermis profundi]|uniref:Uncharacterized protein n=1 Tax=Helicovermis profundi TaxID=3065157 RepID=A0AAU9EC49_9FIRM|nr:hypothetical protein HLPR_27580 [Clostridia bacterium S502]